MYVPKNQRRGFQPPAAHAPWVSGGGRRPGAVEQVPGAPSDSERAKQEYVFYKQSDMRNGEHLCPPSFPSNKTGDQGSKSTIPCRYFREQRCWRGDACPFSHEQPKDSTSLLAPPAGYASSGYAHQRAQTSAQLDNLAHRQGRRGLPQSDRSRGRHRVPPSRQGEPNATPFSGDMLSLEVNNAVALETVLPGRERRTTEEEKTAPEAVSGGSSPRKIPPRTREDQKADSSSQPTDTASASSRRRREHVRHRGRGSFASSAFSRRGAKPSLGGGTYRQVENPRDNAGGTFSAGSGPADMPGQRNHGGDGRPTTARGKGLLSEGSAARQPPVDRHPAELQGTAQGEKASPHVLAHANQAPPQLGSGGDSEVSGGGTGDQTGDSSSADSVPHYRGASTSRCGGSTFPNNRPPCLPPGFLNQNGPGCLPSQWTWRDEYLKLKMLYSSSFLRIYGDDYSSESLTAAAAGRSSSSAQASGRPPRGTDKTSMFRSGTTEEGTRESRLGAGEHEEDNTLLSGVGSRNLVPTEERMLSSQARQEEDNRVDETFGGVPLPGKLDDVVSVVRFTHIPTDPDFNSTLFLPSGLLMEVTVARSYSGYQLLLQEEEKEEKRKPEELRQSCVVPVSPDKGTDGPMWSAPPDKREAREQVGGQASSSLAEAPGHPGKPECGARDWRRQEEGREGGTSSDHDRSERGPSARTPKLSSSSSSSSSPSSAVDPPRGQHQAQRKHPSSPTTASQETEGDFIPHKGEKEQAEKGYGQRHPSNGGLPHHVSSRTDEYNKSRQEEEEEDQQIQMKRLLLGASLRICNTELNTFLLDIIPKVFDEFLEKNPTVPFVIFKALKFVDRHLAIVFALSRMVDRGVSVQMTATPEQDLYAAHTEPLELSSAFGAETVKLPGEAGDGGAKEQKGHQEATDPNREWTEEEQKR